MARPILSRGSEYTHNNRRTVGHRVFYAVRVVSDTQYILRVKQMINSSQNLLLFSSRVISAQIKYIVGTLGSEGKVMKS
jgi:hypothetical protein